MSAYAPIVKCLQAAMTSDGVTQVYECNCLTLRQAARHLTQFYDRLLAPTGLRTTQFSILAKLHGLGPMTINALARELVIDRTTLGRTMLPLEREGLIVIENSAVDRRSKELRLTRKGGDRLRAAFKPWREAQSQFTRIFGEERAAKLRSELCALASSELASGKAPR